MKAVFTRNSPLVMDEIGEVEEVQTFKRKDLLANLQELAVQNAVRKEEERIRKANKWRRRFSFFIPCLSPIDKRTLRSVDKQQSQAVTELMAQVAAATPKPHAQAVKIDPKQLDEMTDLSSSVRGDEQAVAEKPHKSSLGGSERAPLTISPTSPVVVKERGRTVEVSYEELKAVDTKSTRDFNLALYLQEVEMKKKLAVQQVNLNPLQSFKSRRASRSTSALFGVRSSTKSARTTQSFQRSPMPRIKSKRRVIGPRFLRLSRKGKVEKIPVSSSEVMKFREKNGRNSPIWSAKKGYFSSEKSEENAFELTAKDETKFPTEASEEMRQSDGHVPTILVSAKFKAEKQKSLRSIDGDKRQTDSSDEPRKILTSVSFRKKQKEKLEKSSKKFKKKKSTPKKKIYAPPPHQSDKFTVTPTVMFSEFDETESKTLSRVFALNDVSSEEGGDDL